MMKPLEILLTFPYEDTGSCRITKLVNKGQYRRNDVYLEVEAQDGTQELLTVPSIGSILNWHVQEGQTVSYGTELATYLVSEFQIPAIRQEAEEQVWNLAISTNAAFKGLLAYFGNSGQIAQYTVPLQVELDTTQGYEALSEQIVTELIERDLQEGDVVVIADKPFAVAQNRLVSYDLIHLHDPKKVSKERRIELAQELSKQFDFPVTDIDLILADTYDEDKERGLLSTVGAHDHNRIAADIAARFAAKTRKLIDVVISDTDTGIDVREKLIGTITITATPLGSTKGLTIYEAMRVACAAEFSRGSKLRIPIVVCKPILRARNRKDIGAFRGYHGILDLSKEEHIAFA